MAIKQGLAALLCMILLGLLAPAADAHSNNSEGFSTIVVKQDAIDYELQLDLIELNHAIDMGINENESTDTGKMGQIVDARKNDIAKYLNDRLKLYADSLPIEGEVLDTSVTTVNDRPFVILNLSFPVNGMPESLIVNYNVFFDESDPSHANLAKVLLNGEQQEFVFSYEVRDLKIGEITFLSKARQFLSLGMKHIFTGYDHILFVISLLFGARTIKHILSLVTAFTLAHSLTLVLATLEIVTLPGRLVESAIALSIIYVALQNIFNPDSKHHPLIAFAFGLIHGFGFAGILAEMRLDGGHMATTLLFFNVGIEIGQILIVSLIFPILVLLKQKWNVRWVVPGVSTGVLVFGFVWFVQRAFQ
ncbi:HupE/UreJ family protein [Paenibacillus sp. HJGM_3]|uniref:HupE/UreJ family protein n=1 Tax=Paenibacillus sp. HJGM_3 TaxID=3379816 RepID=UPI00385EFD23